MEAMVETHSLRAVQSAPAQIVNVYIVDDPATSDRTLPATLEPWGYLTQEFKAGEQFLGKAGQLPPGIVMLGDCLPGLPGADIHALLALSYAFHRVVFCLSSPDVPATVAAIRRGAVDVLLKPFEESALRAALGSAAGGLGGDSTRVVEEQQIQQRLALLNARQRLVFDGIVAGQSNKQIARTMGISHRTVEVHRSRLMRKLAADSIGDVFRVAALAGVKIG
jgi:two-component system response regulator FixJ